MSDRGWAIPLVIAAFVAMVVAALGATMTDLGPWYQALEKPSWNPPDMVFPIAWTVIFGLTVVAAVVSWRAAPHEGAADWLIILYAFNATLNIGWSILFFRLQRPDWALIELAVLWLSIAVLLVFSARFTRVGSALLIPYLAWVSIAGALNWKVVELNGPFG